MNSEDRDIEMDMKLIEEVKKAFGNGVLNVNFEDVTKIPQSNYADFFLNPLLSDITFLIGEDQAQVPAHKIVLAAHSDVFYNIFADLIPDSTLAIMDVDSASFSNFLEFIYSHNSKLHLDTVFNVLKLATRFNVELLEQKCISFICENITTETAFDFLDKSLRVEHAVMAEILFTFTGRNIEKIIEEDNYKSASYDALLAFIQQPVAKCKERNLAEMSVKWAMERCEKEGQEVTPKNLRNILGTILDNIRFTLMTQDEFDDFIEMHKVLNKSEIEKYRNINEVDKRLTSTRILDFVGASGKVEVVKFYGDSTTCQLTYPNSFERLVEFPEKIMILGIGLRMKKCLDLVEGAYLIINDDPIDLGENFSRCSKVSISDDEDLIRIKFPLAKVLNPKTLYTFAIYNPYGFGVGRNNFLTAVGSDGQTFYHSEPYLPEIHNNALKYFYVKDDEGALSSKLFTDYEI